MAIFKYFAPQCNLFGYGCLEGIEEEIIDRKYKKALIVTDRSICELGIAKKVTDILDNINVPYALFDGIKPNPTVSNVNDGLAVQQKEKCDFVISIGGGSPHDCAKAICILATNGGNILDYKGTNKSKLPALDLIAVNTTAGTGSECTRAYVITDEETHIKSGSRDKNAIAAIAVDDHALMMRLPKGLTAGTGMDALTHAIECYTSKSGFLLTSELALSAIKLIFKNLPDAVNTQLNEKAREGMAVGQYLAGLAFGSGGLGLVHAMSHQLSAVYDLPHGLCNAIVLPVVVKFNSRAVLLRYAELAEEVFPMECMDKKTEEKAQVFFDKLTSLSHIVGTDIKLNTLGVKKEDFKLLADKTLQDSNINNNPIFPTIEEIIELFTELY